ncbi:ABC transporter ATP-binding protein [Anaeromicrobium sediminis]|uniref:ABC transporter domain-containing protein n=1 Tax=Anaeromicrobium sediminis TaxID=1478221 RepID=A0A267MJS6_9FIRM|nr:ABC transporter ATP-binding protein [Anaeromicrobium sediminis]PAB59040.1 hypothetical protein CCE28_12720 [Anaeromicrobium sediminis]
MIKINHVTKKFGDFTAVNALNLEVTTGEFCALLGPNGAGKTTLIKMLIGLLKANEGTIMMDHMIMNRNNSKLKKKIGIVPQHTNLDKDLTVKENLLFSAKLFKIPKIEAEEKADALIDFIDLKSVENRTTRRLSGGMKRKLMIAKALIHDPDIIFMDEPTIGIDLNARRKIWDVLRAMKKEGKTILMTTHYIEEAEYLCDRAALMNSGKVIYYDKPENLRYNLGKYTVEYFNEEKKSMYRYFKTKEEARLYVNSLNDEYTLRDTTLEDVFYNFTNRKVD